MSKTDKTEDWNLGDEHQQNYTVKQLLEHFPLLRYLVELKMEEEEEEEDATPTQRSSLKQPTAKAW